ncbi:MAG: hypothetical protein ILO36_08435 [Abditibacteriota bacterium]|nr:hypothetical protein [Abditibacteriota bacterium]
MKKTGHSKEKMIRGRNVAGVFLALAVLLLPSCLCAKVTMFPQPWRDNGANMREMINDPDGWKEARKGIDAIGCWPWLMEAWHGPEEQKLFFARLKDWGLGLNFEVPVVKGYDWGADKPPLNGTSAWQFYMEQDKLFRENGLERVDAFSFDEPVYACLNVIPHQILAEGRAPVSGFDPKDPEKCMDYAFRETAKFMKLMRQRYPEAEFMDIEPYPAMSLERLKKCVDGLQRECKRLRIKGPDAMRIDVDWSGMESGDIPGSWTEVRELADYCRQKGMKFSLIYWAADKPPLDGRGIELPLQWYSGVLHMLGVTKRMGLEPDEYVVESWIHMPNRFGPETDVTSYTGALKDVLTVIGK